MGQEAVPAVPPPEAPAPVVVETAPPPPPPAVVYQTAPVVAAPPEVSQKDTPAVEEGEEEAPWYSGFTLGGFVDAYAALRSDNNTRPNFGGVPAGGYYHEAYVQADGFSLAFAGVDVNYATEKFGATISLRFGPGTNRFYAANMSDFGIENMTQAFLTYKPTDKLTLDLGQFGTIYGAEVLESWRNVNYSRGALYYAMQPFWHTGLRAKYQFSDAFAVNAMVVNGVNNLYENNKSPSLGIQALLTPSDAFSFALGYLGALNPRDDSNGTFQNFFDAVATVTAGNFKVVANADLNLYQNAGDSDTHNFWGVSIAPAYAFTESFGVGLRYEHLQDSANQWLMARNKIAYDSENENNGFIAANKSVLNTLTATLDIKPVPGYAANFILRPEFRYEIAGDNYFYNKDNELSKNFWSVHLGAVVTSMP
ncbi:MAG: porin [Polyangiales bacterium]